MIVAVHLAQLAVFLMQNVAELDLAAQTRGGGAGGADQGRDDDNQRQRDIAGAEDIIERDRLSVGYRKVDDQHHQSQE